ncbi:PKD domain-containing protein [Labedella gwakjiensis]|uniref:PKD domain-containing protein n=1 Tax=Labedella gwakjiensis TaxID=390269 RepID=UPI001304E00B|nr:PKD domain-containing protein [Labedella gwakjiensis]
MSTDVLPAPQIGDGLSTGLNDTKGSGVVWDQIVIGDTVYVGGSFQLARPAGAGPGEHVVSRSNFLAYNLKTGALLDYAPAFNGQIRTMAVSADQKTLYVGGSFTSVAGAVRYRLAAIDVASGALTSFAPTLNSTVRALAVSKTTVYAGGVFTSAQKTARSGLAAFSASNAAITPWAPVAAPGTVMALVVSPDESKLIVGGRFTTLNGSDNPGRSMGAVRADTGASLPWKVNALLRNGGPSSGITALTSKGGSVYGTAYLANGHEGNFEGTFRASWTDGTLEWVADCHGDTYSVAVSDTAVYTTSHAHACEGVGGFAEGTKSVSSDVYHRALAFSTERTGTLRPWTVWPYGNFGGQPAPSLLDWYPDVRAGKVTGTTQAAWDVTTAQGYVLLGGEFPTVNGVNQQGLARFAPKTIAPNTDGPQLEKAAMAPTVTSWGGSYAKISWAANYDRDNASLTYQVIRDGNTSKPVFQTTVQSRFWQRPTVQAVDGYLTPGKTYSYRIRTIDPFGNVKLGNAVSYTVPANPMWTSPDFLTSYDKKILQDQPSIYWGMNEPGATAYDWARSNNHAQTVSTRGSGVEGVAGGSAAVMNGVNSYASAVNAVTAPNVYSNEMWIKTTTKAGGVIMNFASSRSSGPDAAERFVVMNNAGKLVFGVTPVAGVVDSVSSAASYNDGRWHHVVATLGTGGLQLYVDGASVASRATPTAGYAYSGYWHIGGHTGAQSWAGSPTTSNFFAGSIDNVAVYNRVLSSAQVASHYAAAAPKANVLPVASFTSSSTELAVSVDGSGSSDADGKVASYAWDFGDGSTGSGAKTSHAFGKAGTYTVALTVTDDRGGKSTVSKQVTVSATPTPPAPAGVVAQDAFERSAASGWGSATTGGAWAAAKGSTSSVGDGVGKLTGVKGQTSTVALPGASSDSSDTTLTFRLDNAATGGGQAVTVVGRQIGADSYTARVWVQSNGVLQLQLQRSGKSLSVLNLKDVAYVAGEPVHIRFQVTGTVTTTVQAKVWTTGAEPADWTRSVTDTTAVLQAAGSVGLGLYVSASATAGSTVSFDDYLVKKVTP